MLLYILLAKLQFFAGKHSVYAGAALKKFVEVPVLYAFLMSVQLLESEEKKKSVENVVAKMTNFFLPFQGNVPQAPLDCTTVIPAQNK